MVNFPALQMSTLKNPSRQTNKIEAHSEKKKKKVSAFMKNDLPLRLLRSYEKDEEKRLINSGGRPRCQEMSKLNKMDS